MKLLVVLMYVHLSLVLSKRDTESHPLLFQSHHDKMSEIRHISRQYNKKQVFPQFPEQLQDTGHATNCGDPTHNFSLTWTPKIVNPSHGVLLHLHLVPVITFTSGIVSVSVYTGKSQQPFITDEVPLNCALIRKKLPQLKCPINKGAVVDLSYSVPDLTALPPGSYKLKIDIKDEKTDFLCAELVVEIKDPTH